MRRRAWKRTLGLCFILFLVLGAYGCETLVSTRTIGEREPGPGLRPATASYRFEDLPIPSDVTLNRKDSFVFETGKIKTGLLVYEGKGETASLTTFFKQKMPQYQWRLVSNFELNNVMLIFIKEGMTAVIYILPYEGEGKRIEIRVGPVDLKIVPAS